MEDQFKPSSKPASQIIDGFQIPAMFPADSFKSALKYKPRPDDVILATYPKCGTTWATQVLLLIFRHGEQLGGNVFMTAAPFLEVVGAEAAEKMARPCAIKSHLPYHLTPRSDDAKYIYVSRNPMDCCVSYYHHMKNLPVHCFNGTFDEFFELFISGNIDYGDYFDHLLGWYSHRNDPNVLFLTYEEMKEDAAKAILKMASFIDDKLYAEPLRNDPAKLQNVLKFSSFDHMKKEVNQSMDDMTNKSKEDISKSELPDGVKELFSKIAELNKGQKPSKSMFVRKGIVGDWKNYFTEEQAERLRKKFAERTKDTDIPKLYEKYML